MSKLRDGTGLTNWHEDSDSSASKANDGKSVRIPIVESSVFAATSDASRFAVGVVAERDVVHTGFANEFHGSAKLRAGVYLHEGFVTATDLDEDGNEFDVDDARSIHFVLVERTTLEGYVRVVGTLRLIVKEAAHALLPVERFYPEAFGVEGAPTHSVEVSRLICQHEDPIVQSIMKWPLFVCGLMYVEEHQLGPAYGLLEPRLARALAAQSVPVRELSTGHFVPEINAFKQPVEIDTQALRRVVGSTHRTSTSSFTRMDLGPVAIPLPVVHPIEGRIL